jgi:hypothetical protein
VPPPAAELALDHEGAVARRLLIPLFAGAVAAAAVVRLVFLAAAVPQAGFADVLVESARRLVAQALRREHVGGLSLV